MIYLAAPYHHEQWAVRAGRVDTCAAVAAWIHAHIGEAVYAPTVYGHWIEEAGPWRQSHAFWLAHCLEILPICKALYVLRLEGWEVSKGVAREIEEARRLEIPLWYVDWDDGGVLHIEGPVSRRAGECDLCGQWDGALESGACRECRDRYGCATQV